MKYSVLKVAIILGWNLWYASHSYSVQVPMPVRFTHQQPLATGLYRVGDKPAEATIHGMDKRPNGATTYLGKELKSMLLLLESNRNADVMGCLNGINGLKAFGSLTLFTVLQRSLPPTAYCDLAYQNSVLGTARSKHGFI